jgi:hypothetical protein
MDFNYADRWASIAKFREKVLDKFRWDCFWVFSPSPFRERAGRGFKGTNFLAWDFSKGKILKAER